MVENNRDSPEQLIGLDSGRTHEFLLSLFVFKKVLFAKMFVHLHFKFLCICLLLCMCARCVPVCMHATVHVWKLEDNFQKGVLPFHWPSNHESLMACNKSRRAQYFNFLLD